MAHVSLSITRDRSFVKFWNFSIPFLLLWVYLEFLNNCYLILLHLTILFDIYSIYLASLCSIADDDARWALFTLLSYVCNSEYVRPRLIIDAYVCHQNLDIFH